MIELTSNAAGHLRGLLEEKGLDTRTAGLRLAIEKGGCAGLQYTMTLGEKTDGDLLVEKDGATVFVDPESASFLSGCTVDYVDELSGAGFRIINPRAVRSCGCGTSFEPMPESAS